MAIVREIMEAIQRNPDINRVVVSQLEYAKIRREMRKMMPFRNQKRPTYGGRYGAVDRLLWDNLIAMQRMAPVFIMGRPVEADPARRLA